MPILGRDLVFSVNTTGVVTDDPTTLTYTPIALTTSKALDLSPNTVDGTSDASGATTQTMVTRLDAELTATAQIEKKDADSTTAADIVVLLNDKVQSGEQPVLWCNIAGENTPLELYGWTVITGCNLSFNTDEIMTVELTFKPAATDTSDQTWFINKVTA